MVYDYLIIGQGLAGTHVAWQALQEGQTPLIVDEPRKGAASGAAGGLVNPVTGRRLTKSWRAAEVIPFAKETYQAQEALLARKFYYPSAIVRLFKDAAQRRQWEEKRMPSPDYAQYRQSEKAPEEVSEAYHDEEGGVVLGPGGYLMPYPFLQAFRKWFVQKGLLTEAPFRYGDLKLYSSHVEWRGLQAKFLISCEGWRVADNPFFGNLPLKPVKGQVLTVDAPKLPGEYVVNKGLWVIPVNANQFRIGATYEPGMEAIEPSEEAYQKLVHQIDQLLKVPYKVVERQFGIRPAMKDGMPVVGWHKGYPRIGILNGLGSKGVMQAPYLARQLLTQPAEEGILNEMNVNRYL